MLRRPRREEMMYLGERCTLVMMDATLHAVASMSFCMI